MFHRNTATASADVNDPTHVVMYRIDGREKFYRFAFSFDDCNQAIDELRLHRELCGYALPYRIFLRNELLGHSTGGPRLVFQREPVPLEAEWAPA
jgi:hypothetical protein